MNEKVKELLYQALETEIGGQAVYKAAIECAVNKDLREEWQKYLDETENHERILRTVFERVGMNASKETPGREVVRLKGQSLVNAMELARRSGTRAAAQMVAAESVVEAETKDHQNWEVIGVLAKTLKGEEAAALSEAYEEVEEEEDEHLYHTMGWSRELWLEFLGLPAQLPPPEEKKMVTTGVDAAKTQNQRLDEAKKSTPRPRSTSRTTTKPRSTAPKTPTRTAS